MSFKNASANWTIRNATPDDVINIAAMHTASWRVTYCGMLRDQYLDQAIEEERRQHWLTRFQHLDNNRQCALVVEVQNTLAGFAFAYGHADPNWGSLLDNLHVLPDYKHQGLGKALLSNIALWSCLNFPGDGLFLWAFEDNHSAKDFYEKQGGIASGSMLWTAPDGSTINEICYIWKDPRILTTL